MGKLEDFKNKHLHFLARAATLNQQVGKDKKLLDSVTVFIAELQAFLDENKKKIESKKAAELIAWRDYWIKLTKSYR